MHWLYILIAVIVLSAVLILLGSLFIFRAFAINKRVEKHRELRPEPWGSLGRNLIKAEKRFMEEMRPEELWLTVRGARLHGYYVHQGSDRTVILIHGWKDNAQRRMDSAEFYYDRGWNIFIPDLRAHGMSDGKYCGMGVNDRFDILDWIKLLEERYGKTDILLDGISMGAATTCSLTGDSEMPECVKAAVSDSAFTSLWQLVPELMDPLPCFLRPLFRVLTQMWCRLFAGYGFKQDEPVKKVACSHTPTLFIHGDDDHLVPFYMSRLMYDACSAPKEYLAVPGAGHILAWWLDKETYENRLDAFLDKYMRH